jgi:hypothetical protein
VYPHVPEAASSSEGDLHVQTQLGAMRVKVGIKWTSMRMFIGVSALMMMTLMAARHMKGHSAIAALKAHLMIKTLRMNLNGWIDWIAHICLFSLGAMASQACFFHLRRLQSSRQQLGHDVTVKLVVPLVAHKIASCIVS